MMTPGQCGLPTYLDVACAPVDAGGRLSGRLVNSTSLAAQVRLVADDDDRRTIIAVFLRDDLIPEQLDTGTRTESDGVGLW